MPAETLAIRAARAEDMPACAAIHNAWIDETPWMVRVHPASDTPRHYRETVWPASRLWVAEEGARIAGFLALDAAGCIGALYLAPPARGRGIGAALLERAKATRPEGLTLWAFAANEGARRFYAREGFREIRRTAGDNEEGLADILLAWEGRP